MNATRRDRSLKIHSLESLDGRITPTSLMPFHPVTAPILTYAPDGTKMDKLGQTLNIVYREFDDYVKHGAQVPFQSSQSSKVTFRLHPGSADVSKLEVEVKISASKALFDQALQDSAKYGIVAPAYDRAHGIITGFIPISKLAGAANDSNFTSLAPEKGVTQGSIQPRMG